MSTPHNMAEPGQIAKTVIMPGDPLRAKYIAEKFLDNAVCFNTIRNMFGYTGSYEGKKVSVMGSGMGMPSIGLYTYELYQHYDVDNIIRVGTAGGYGMQVDLKDVVIAMATSTDSNYAAQYQLPGTFAPTADFGLLRAAVAAAEKKQIPVHVGNVLSSDYFTCADSGAAEQWKSMGVLAVEMECAALYMNAAYLHKKALGIFTVSDHIFKGGALTAKERVRSVDDMISIALEVV